MRNLTYDVVVIGAGLSGMLAAAGARRQGARVALLAEGQGMMELFSGCVDLLAALPDGTPVPAPWEMLDRLPESHPYGLLGLDAVREGLAAFQSVCTEMGQGYRAAPNLRNQWLVTAVGSLRPTFYVAPTMASPLPGEQVLVVGFRGISEFNPEVVAEGLKYALPGTTAVPARVDLPDELTQPIQVARAMDSAPYRAEVIRRVKEAVPAGLQPTLVLVPGVLGIERSAAARSELSAALGATVSEVALLSPSLPGLRLANVWRRYLQQQGVDFRLGVKVTGARVEHGRVQSVQGVSAGGAVEFHARAFVLAAGGLLGCGIVSDGRRLQEPVFGLTVEEPAGAWASPELLPAGGHAFVRAGIRTGADLRPEGFANLYLCGRMLAGYDPYHEGCGGGVAVATGWYAGRQAGGVA